MGLTRDDITDIDWLLFCSPSDAAGIVKRRRKELASIRALRLVALRNQVPKDIVGHIESYIAPAGLGPVPPRSAAALCTCSSEPNICAARVTPFLLVQCVGGPPSQC